ncbi:MAG: peptide chain release factor N(5)-glutamine methyltransferase, partial [Pseudomonadota bacterium]
DLGTGSGCLLVTLLAEWPEATGTGVDISDDALTVARANAEAHGVAGRVHLQQANWLERTSGSFDLIVSNPPYLSEAELADVSPEVREYEPCSALVSGPEGLEAYRAIAADAGRVLAPGGLLMLELGAMQSEPVAALIAEAGWNMRALIPDFDHRPRVIVAAR